MDSRALEAQLVSALAAAGGTPEAADHPLALAVDSVVRMMAEWTVDYGLAQHSAVAVAVAVAVPGAVDGERG